MSIIDKAQLLGFRSQTRTQSKGLNGSLVEFLNESRQNKITIFLSHKHDERTELDATIQFLKQIGVNVYVDWLDEEMPKSTSGDTATRIKRKIEENQKFIFLATEGAINSRWCNWELGIGDTHKYIHNIAILPVRDDSRSYSGNEYLQIYPSIEYVKPGSLTISNTNNYLEEGYYVLYPRDSNGSRQFYDLYSWINRW